MKTKSIKSIAALVGAAVVLNASVLAGPGPQEYRSRNVSVQKKVVVTSSPVRKAPTAAKAVVKSEPALTYVSGPKGGTYAFRN